MSRTKLSKRINKWDLAIQDGEKAIERMKTAVEVLKKQRDAGEPWPGTANQAPKKATQD